jgi:hypothetical protein
VSEWMNECEFRMKILYTNFPLLECKLNIIFIFFRFVTRESFLFSCDRWKNTHSIMFNNKFKRNVLLPHFYVLLFTVVYNKWRMNANWNLSKRVLYFCTLTSHTFSLVDRSVENSMEPFLCIINKNISQKKVDEYVWTLLLGNMYFWCKEKIWKIRLIITQKCFSSFMFVTFFYFHFIYKNTCIV